jgi:hypothetical protein
MQIHELTKRQLDEGIIDALKVSLSKDPAIDGMNYKQASQYLKTSKAVETIATKAQQAWEVYAKQLEQFISTQPVAAPATAAPSTAAQKPSEVLNVAGGTATKGADGKWRNQAGVEYNPASVEKLEQMAGQRRQMSPASGIKEAAAPVTPGNIAKRSASRNAAVAPAPTVTAPTTPATRVDALTAFRNRTDGKYKQALRAFVQKNLLSGMQYSRLANAQDIEQLINLISRPENATSNKQAPLWRQLAQSAAVTYTIPAEAGGLGTPETSAGGEAEPDNKYKNETPEELAGTVKQAMDKNRVDTANLAKAGQTIRTDFTNNDAKIKSTGNAAVDALLKNMGFEI